MHVKWNRNLDGIRRPSSPLYTQLTNVTSSDLLLSTGTDHFDVPNDTDGNNNDRAVFIRKASRYANSAFLQTTNGASPSVTTNRITSKGALKTLIGLFRFRNEELNRHHCRLRYNRRRLSLERLSSVTSSHPNTYHRTPSHHRRRAHSVLVLQDVPTTATVEQCPNGCPPPSEQSIQSVPISHSVDKHYDDELKNSLDDNDSNSSSTPSINSISSDHAKTIQSSSSPSLPYINNYSNSNPSNGEIVTCCTDTPTHTEATNSHTPATPATVALYDRQDLPKKVLVKFIDDEPTYATVIDANLKDKLYNPDHKRHTQPTRTMSAGFSGKPLQGILRVRNDSSDFLSFRSSSASSSSTSSSCSSTNKKVHFAYPLHTCSIFDGF